MSLSGFIANLKDAIIFPLLSLLLALAFLVFFWGLAQFILKAGEDADRQEGKRHMLWGIIGIFIMLSVLGILRIVTNTFGVDLPNQ